MIGHTTTGHPANKWQQQLLKNKLLKPLNIMEKATTFTKRFICFLWPKNV